MEGASDVGEGWAVGHVSRTKSREGWSDESDPVDPSEGPDPDPLVHAYVDGGSDAKE